MKSSLLLFIFLMACQLTYSQDFITQWSFFHEPTSEIKFSALTTDTVHYTWSTSPSGNSGFGSFIQKSSFSVPVILKGLYILPEDTLTLNIESDNLSRFYFEGWQKQETLIEVSQWGDVSWTSMHRTFYGAENLIMTATDTPDLSNVTDMSEMFSRAFIFDQDLGGWDVSNVTDMSEMFSRAQSFNQDISGWDVSNVTDMFAMFYRTQSFNQDISGWDVSNVTDMHSMFWGSNNFDQNIGGWDVSNVTDMKLMFISADTFNQDISGWDVSNVTDMFAMFDGASSFNQDIGNWKLHPTVNMENMLDDSGMNCNHYSTTLIGWQKNNPAVTDVELGADGLQFGTSAVAARDSLINAQGWTIEGDVASGMDCDSLMGEENQDFITQWTFDVTTTDLRFSALTTDTVHYTWTASPSGNSGNGSFIQTNPDSVTLNGLNVMSGDTVTLHMVSDNLSRFYFESGQDQGNLFDVTQWGDVSWTSMSKAFSGCSFLNISAIDTPDLINVSRMDSMFYKATKFNDDIGHWDVSNVTDMKLMFSRASWFNQDIGRWDVSNVDNMGFMFTEAGNFNQDIGEWDVSSVKDMSFMFTFAASFNQDISGWDVSNVTNMSRMFYVASSFNQKIGEWNVSKVTNMTWMFREAISFNKAIGAWNVSNVENMSGMFSSNNTFNQDIGEWDVSNVTNMSKMFSYNNTFNKDISGWDVSSVSNMERMFYNNNAFNQDIREWNVSNVKNMGWMFGIAKTFNQDISNWEVSNATIMSGMFAGASSFNQDISRWDVSNVKFMRGMFSKSESFNQDIGDWNMNSQIDLNWVLDSVGMDCDHYSATLVGWKKNNPAVTNVTLGAAGLQYGTSATAARDSLINIQGWSIIGDEASEMVCDALVSADYTASDQRMTIYPNPASDQIIIPMNNVSYKIISAEGRVIQDGVVQGQPITLENLSVGLYILQVVHEREVYRAKFIKQ